MTMSPFTCYECGKIIKGKVIFYAPPQFMIDLGLDFIRAYHPKCHEKAEARAAAEMPKTAGA